MNRNQKSLPARSTQKARSQSQKIKKRKKNRNGNPRVGLTKPALHLAQCALSYARAKLDPFNSNENELPCIPDLLDLPSYKFVTKNRGVFTVGADGLGYVMVAPFVFNNDLAFQVTTGASFAGVNMTTANPTTGVAFAGDAKFPWTSLQPRNVRCVAMGLRVRYTGTQLNLGGMLILHSNPGNQTYSGRSVNDMTSLPDSIVHPCTRQWKGTVWNSGYATAYQYSNIGTNTIGATTSSQVGLLAMTTGTPGNTYEFEVIRYFEAVGFSSPTTTEVFPVPSTSKSHSDPVGLGLVKDFLSSQTASDVGQALVNKFLAFATNGAGASATTFFASSVPSLGWR